MFKVKFKTVFCSVLIVALAVGYAEARSVRNYNDLKVDEPVQRTTGFKNYEAMAMLKNFYNTVIKKGCTSKYSHVRAGITPRMLQTLKNKEAVIVTVNNCFTGAGGDMCDDSIVSVKAIGDKKFKVTIRGHYGSEPKTSPNYRYTTIKTVTMVKSGDNYLIDDVK